MMEPFQRRERCTGSSRPQARGEGPRNRARSLEPQARRHELVADRFEVLGEHERAERARELAAACRAEARRWRLLAR
jgi:hypothetical protein